MNGKIVSFNISFDPEAGAMYIQVSPNKVAKTIELENDILVDVDSKGKMRGMEFLNPSKIDINIQQIIKVFKAPQLDRFKPKKLQKAFETLAEAAPSR